MMFLISVLSLFYSISATLYADVITDLIKYCGRTSVITEFSCNRSESITLLKELMQNGYQTKILPVNYQNLGNPMPPNHQVFVLDLKCNNSSQLLKKVDKINYFQTPYKWIIYESRRIPFEKVIDHFDNISVLLDSDVTLCFLQKDNKVQIHKIYKRSHNSTLEIENMGHYSKDIGFIDFNFEKSTAKRRKNLKGIPLKTSIVITNNDSLNHLNDKRDKHIDSIAKVNYVLVEHLKEVLNATLIYSIQSTWGYRNGTPEWGGMIGELTRKEADIGGTPLFFTIDRVDIIDYVAMTTPTRSKFVFRQPKLSYVTNVFILPFDKKVWASTLSLVFVVGLVLYVIIKWERKKYKRAGIHRNAPELKPSIIDVVLFTFAALCQQGASVIPSSVPGRIATISLYISFMFLYTSYSANIVALLQSSSNSIQTLGDLLRSRIQIGVDDTVFNRFYFPNSSEPVRRALYLQKVVPKGKKENFMSIEEGVEKLRQGLFAFHMATGPGYKLVSETFEEREKCGLQDIQFLQVVDPWLAVQKKSSYKEIIKIGLRKIQESGLQNREVGLIYTKKPTCTATGSSFISVGLIDCYFACVIMAGGLVLALMVFLLEVYVNYRKNTFKNVKHYVFSFPRGKKWKERSLKYPLPYND